MKGEIELTLDGTQSGKKIMLHPAGRRMESFTGNLTPMVTISVWDYGRNIAMDLSLEDLARAVRILEMAQE